MALPQNFPRDQKGKLAQMLQKKTTDSVFEFLEALAMGKVTVAPAGRGSGQILATPRHWQIALNLTTPLFGATVSVSVSPLDRYLFSVATPGLADKTPLSVDMGTGHDAQIIQGGAYVSGGSAFVQFYNTDNATTRSLNGYVTVAAHP